MLGSQTKGALAPYRQENIRIYALRNLSVGIYVPNCLSGSVKLMTTFIRWKISDGRDLDEQKTETKWNLDTPWIWHALEEYQQENWSKMIEGKFVSK